MEIIDNKANLSQMLIDSSYYRFYDPLGRHIVSCLLPIHWDPNFNSYSLPNKIYGCSKSYFTLGAFTLEPLSRNDIEKNK